MSAPSADSTLESRVDWLIAQSAKHDGYLMAIGQSVEWLVNTFHFITQALENSPLGPMLRKQAAAIQNQSEGN